MDMFSIIYIAILILAFYLLIIRPQQVRNKQMRELIASLSVGDRVITIGGMHGQVTAVTDETVLLKIYDSSVVEYEKSAVARIVRDVPPLDETAGDKQ